MQNFCLISTKNTEIVLIWVTGFAMCQFESIGNMTGSLSLPKNEYVFLKGYWPHACLY
jgi:hypothetical protein